MNDVVAVALITAVATLAAGAVTGAFAYGAARRQTVSQEKQAREARAEQRVVRHREVRREIYVRLLNQKDEAHRQINKVWAEAPPPTKEAALQVLYDVADPVGNSYTLISLEGPPNVAEAAQAIFEQIQQEVYLLLSLLERADGSQSLYEKHGNRYASTVAGRPGPERAFVQAARVVLGGNLAEPE
jgi:hypothetical protein